MMERERERWSDVQNKEDKSEVGDWFAVAVDVII